MDGSAIREPHGDLKLLPSDPASDCQVRDNGDFQILFTGYDFCVWPTNLQFSPRSLETGMSIQSVAIHA